MKTLALLLFSTMCLGQQSAEIVPLQMPSHPQHAQVQPLQSEGTYAVAQGEQSVLDTYHPVEVPLGTIAKLCREDPKDQRCIYKGDK